MNKLIRAASTGLISAALVTAIHAEGKYDPGASDTEIRIGNIAPLTGAFSEYGAESKAQAAYFQMINDRGGINGRKITYISVDGGSEPFRSGQLAKHLVEEDHVLLLFSTFGNRPNEQIRTYANEKKIPQLFVQSSSSRFDDPAHYPWTMGFLASYRTEALAYARYIRQTWPAAHVAVLRADDEVGREFVAGLHDGLGDKADMIVGDGVFKYSDPATIDMQLQALKSSGADVLINLAVGKFGSQAIRSTFDMGWHPTQFIPNSSLSIAAFLDPAGVEKAVGIISNARSKGTAAAQPGDDGAVRDYLEWMRKYNPDASMRDQINVAGYERAATLVEVLRKCGDDLTRANVMKQAASLDFDLGLLRPGIRITTSPTDYQPIKQLYLVKFNGKAWVPVGAVVGS